MSNPSNAVSNPDDCRYTDEHEWAKAEGKTVRVGITHYAQTELGDVVFVEPPQVGGQVRRGESFASVESVKAVSDIYAPVDGTVTLVNEKLSKSPELINSSPYAAGWIAVIEPSNPEQIKELKSAEEYTKYIAALSK